MRRRPPRSAAVLLLALVLSNLSCDAPTEPPESEGFFLYVGGQVSRPDESRGAILRWNGSTWEDVRVPIPRVSAIRGTGLDDVVFAGSRSVLRFDGEAITPLLEEGAAQEDWGLIEAVWPAGPGMDGEVFAVGYWRTALRGSGSSWTTMDPFLGDTGELPNYSLFGIWGFGPADIFAAGGEFAPSPTASRIWHFDGTAWSLMDIPSGDERLWDVWGPAPDDVFAVGFFGTILHYDGADWTSMQSPYGGSLYGVHGTGSHEVYVVGNAGTILHYDGETWREMESATTEAVRAVWARAPGEAYAVTLTGAVLRYDGEAWTIIREAEEGLYLYTVWAAD